MAVAACLRNRCAAAFAALVLVLACSRAADSQQAADAIASSPQGARIGNAAAGRQLMGHDGRACGPGQQPDRHGRPHPCPPGTAKGEAGAHPCRRCRGAVNGHERYQSRSGATKCALCTAGGHVTAARTKCIPPPSPPGCDCAIPQPGVGAPAPAPACPVPTAATKIGATLVQQGEAKLNAPLNFTGQTYLDINGDGIKQPTEPVYPGMPVFCALGGPGSNNASIPDPPYTISYGVSGTFLLTLDAIANAQPGVGRFLDCFANTRPISIQNENSFVSWNVNAPPPSPPSPPGN